MGIPAVLGESEAEHGRLTVGIGDIHVGAVLYKSGQDGVPDVERRADACNGPYQISGLSDAAALTGQTLTVDGGLVLR